MNQLLDYLPIALFAVVFFGTDSPDNIYYATAALMAGVTLQVLIVLALKKPVSGMLKFTFGISIIMGAATLLLRDGRRVHGTEAIRRRGRVRVECRRRRALSPRSWRLRGRDRLPG